jgi:hypothetical protein
MHSTLHYSVSSTKSKGSTPIQEAAFGEYDGLAKAPIKQENK